MTRFSIELATAFRAHLFERDMRAFIAEGAPVTYDLKPGMESLARQTWAVHGVCLSCRRWSITCGNCVECAVSYRAPEVSIYDERPIQRQIDLAASAIGGSI